MFQRSDLENFDELILPFNSGVLLHCISGWDRTPFYVSLLRLSLWADNAVHQNLSSIEIIYFTISYDWLLFGHNLKTRASQNVELLYFCFYMLGQINDYSFSLNFNTNITNARRERRLVRLWNDFIKLYSTVCLYK